LGLKWLKGLDSGKYFHEDYCAHVEIWLEDFAVFVTDKRVLMARISSGRTDWEIPFAGKITEYMKNLCM
jgi:vacuolar protein sorting-associated protein 13A/C